MRFVVPEHAAVQGQAAVVLQRLLRDPDVRGVLAAELRRLDVGTAQRVQDTISAIEHAAETHQMQVEQVISEMGGNVVAEIGGPDAPSGHDLDRLTSAQVARLLDLTSARRVCQLAERHDWFGTQDKPRGPWHFTTEQVHQMMTLRNTQAAS